MLPLPRRRAVVQLLAESVVINRAGRSGGRVFDPETIALTWRPEIAA